MKFKTLDSKEIELNIPPKLLKIAEDIQAENGRAFLVGGFVRDSLLGILNSRDYDIEVYHLSQETLLKILSRYGKVNIVGKAFGVFHLAMHGLSLDFSFPRTESKIGKGHRGFIVETHTNLTFKEAAARRDFTINAMGMELPSLELCDPYGGREDLKNGILKHVSMAFCEDSLRILRGVQFASRFHLKLDASTIALCKTLSLEDLSRERILEEFKKWFLKPGKPSVGLKAFLQIDLLKFFPEIKPLDNSYEKLGEFLDNISEASRNFDDETRLILSFSALLFANKDLNEVQKFLEKITNEIRTLKEVPLFLKYAFTLSLNEKIPEDKTIRRLSVAFSGLKYFLTFITANPVYTKESRIFYFDSFKKQAELLGVYDEAPVPFLTGKFLKLLGVKQGKAMGILIKECFEMQLDGIIRTKEDAENFARKRLS